METIHLKTVDSIGQELLRSASRQGLETTWERFEKLQPQDGFLRLGLSCPFGCLQGPCRIDPFGRGPAKGVCGLAADEMVAGMLLRLCQQGAMEALAALPTDRAFPDLRFSPILAEMVSRALSAHDQPDLSINDIFKSSALLSRPSANFRELLMLALRLSLLTLGFQEQGAWSGTAESLPCAIGYTSLANQSVRIGLTGQPSAAFIAALGKEIARESATPVQLVALGDWLVLEERFLPIACSSGESELLVSSGAIHLLVAGPGTDPGLTGLCDSIDIPVVADSQAADAAELIQRARRSLASRSQLDLFTRTPVAPEHQVLMSGANLLPSSRQDSGRKIALIGGSDMVHVSLGKLPVELADELSEKGMQLGGWGDAALWVLKRQSSSNQQAQQFGTLDNHLGPLLAVTGLAASGRLDSLQGICFTGMKQCRELGTALGLACLGCRVSVATPIPIRGSQTVIDALSGMLQQNGGQLRHFDHPATVGELSEWFIDS